MSTLRAAIWVVLCALAALCQSTQGLISGRIVDSQSGRRLPGVQILGEETLTGRQAAAETDASGYYVLPMLSPGAYSIRAVTPDYQPQEVHELELGVGGRLDLDFRLRPLRDVWESGQYRSVFLPGSRTLLTFYGPDVDTSRTSAVEPSVAESGVLQTSISQVVRSEQIMNLPLQGRDPYNILIIQPGVTADTTTARSLGLSANGQRPSASHFLLDGVDNNNLLVSGPLMSLAPEALQEYRVSTNAFSAEFGSTSGYLANAVTRGGTNDWHGIGYLHIKNEALNANDFQSNLAGQARLPAKSWQPGFWAGGPLQRDRWFAAGWFEHLRSRARRQPQTLAVPSTLLSSTAVSPLARQLLAEFPLSVNAEGNTPFVPVQVAAPVTVDRQLYGARLDRQWSEGRQRLMGRFAGGRLDRPDLSWTPYPDFVSGLTHDTNSLVLSFQNTLSPSLTLELRAGGAWESLSVPRKHDEIPVFESRDGALLPGSQIFSAFEHDATKWELAGNLMAARGKHTVTLGGGLLRRGLEGILTAGDSGSYFFNSVIDFSRGLPAFFRAPLDRAALPDLAVPDPYREYALQHFFVFAQNSHRVTPRLALNYGARYEFSGAPSNVGDVKDGLVQLGQGSSLAASVVAAQLVFPGSGDQPLYASDRNDWAGRFGFSLRPWTSRSTLIRGSYGVFYDRPYENVWLNVRNNRFILPTAFTVSATQRNFLAPVSETLPTYAGRPITSTFSARSAPILYQPDFRNGYVHTYFLGLQQPLSANWFVEVNGLGSAGRKLITTDIINRSGGPLGPVSYRANQGTSNYNALAALIGYRAGWTQFQASYTWSHTIDIQSDLFRNDYFNLNPTRLTAREVRVDSSAFSREFDSSADRGNSDFDQRHNLVLSGIVEVPSSGGRGLAGALTRNWRISSLAAFRSGFPYTVFAQNTGTILNNRASLVVADPFVNREVAGGRLLLDPSAFARPATGEVGNLGRNAFLGPGFYNIDASLSRSFPAPWMGEQGRIILRADVYNVLNHANLTMPDAIFGAPNFGVARYGRYAPQSGLPILSPLDDSGRQIELMLRILF
jgi:hypothetical protein